MGDYGRWQDDAELWSERWPSAPPQHEWRPPSPRRWRTEVPSRKRSRSRSPSLWQRRSPARPCWPTTSPSRRRSRSRSPPQRTQSQYRPRSRERSRASRRWRSSSRPRLESPPATSSFRATEVPAKPPATRNELLRTRVVSMDEFRERREDSAWKARKLGGKSCSLIPVPLCRGDSAKSYEREFQRWLATRGFSLDDLRDDALRERSFRCGFAQQRAQRENPSNYQVTKANATPALPTNVNSHPVLPSQTTKIAEKSEQVYGAMSGGATRSGYTNAVLGPTWQAITGINVEEGGTAPKKDACCCQTCEEKFAGLATRMKLLEGMVANLQRQLPGAGTAAASPLKPFAVSSAAEAVGNMENLRGDVQTVTDEKAHQRHADVVSPRVEHTAPPPINELTEHTEETTSSACPGSVQPLDEDVHRRLTEVYDHQNEQILLNEKAVEDSLAHVQTMVTQDEGAAQEFRSQIDELQTSINQEKSKRDNAVADLILHGWSTRRQELVLLLEATPTVEVPKAQVSLHKKNADVAGRLKSTAEKRVKLYAQWDICKRLSSDSGLPVLSSKMIAEEVIRKRLEDERQKVYVDLLKCSQRIRARVVDGLAKADAHGLYVVTLATGRRTRQAKGW